MSRGQFRGRGRVVFCPTIADPSAPTVTEVGAGTDLTRNMLPDGLDTPLTGNVIDASDASSLFNKQALGSYGGDAIQFQFHLDSKPADNVAWTTLARETTGFLVVTRWGWAQDPTTGLGTPSGTPTLADKCEVYPVTVSTRAPASTADGQTNRATASLAVTDEPEQDAVVAAAA